MGTETHTQHDKNEIVVRFANKVEKLNSVDGAREIRLLIFFEYFRKLSRYREKWRWSADSNATLSTV